MTFECRIKDLKVATRLSLKKKTSVMHYKIQVADVIIRLEETG